MKKIYAFAMMMAMAGIAQAQNKLTGTIKDNLTGKPLAGASITIGNNTITTSDANGEFQIACVEKAVLNISFVGYEPISKRINNCQSPLNIGLTPKTNGELEDVEITATTSTNKTLLYQPVSITKMSRKEIARGMGLFMYDAINVNVPGVSMSSRTVSAGQQFNIRGYGNGVRGTNGVSSNFDGQGYKVYLNGIPVTDAEGITTMDDIDFGSVGKVEVTKGPAGTLYGLAVSGVVNLNTVRPPAGQSYVGQDVLVGNYGTQRFTTQVGIGGEKSSLLINYGYQHADGYMNHTESTKKFANAIGGFEFSKKQSLDFYVGYSDSYEKRGGELTITQYDNDDFSGNPEYIKRNAHSNVISFRSGIKHTYHFSNRISNTTTLFGSGASSNVSSAGGWTDKSPVNYGLRSTFDMHFEVGKNLKLNGIAGVEAQGQYAQTIGYNMVPDPNNPNGYWIVGAMRSNQYTKTGTSSFFTEWSLALPTDISVTAGLGYSNMMIQLNDRFYVANSTKPTTYEQDYNNMFSPHVAVNKVFSKRLSVYGSYSKGYKAPVSSYFFIPATGQLNTRLKPEIGEQFEIGSKGSLLNDRFNYQLALFDAKFKNKMTAIAVPLNATTTAYSYIANGGTQHHKGLEAAISYEFAQKASGLFTQLRPFANITLTDFKYEDFRFQRLNNPPSSLSEADFSGKEVAGVPKLAANMGIDAHIKQGLYANLTYSYRDGFPITSDNTLYTAAYNLLNGKIGYQKMLGRHFNIDAFFGVNNITGVKYPLMVFVNQLPDAYLPGPRNANYFGGANIRYIF